MVAARGVGVIWTDQNLDQYLQAPQPFLQQVTGASFDKESYMTFFIGGSGAGADSRAE